MSKRPNPMQSDHGAKRQQIKNPDYEENDLKRLIDNADELINSLQFLKTSEAASLHHTSKTSASDIEERLLHLKKTLLPSLQSIASAEKNELLSLEQNDQPQMLMEGSSRAVSTTHTPSQNIQSLRLPSMVEVTPWTSSEVNHEWPALPQVSNPKLEEEAFTHPGLNHLCNYERLEWLGDAYLELIATALIHKTFEKRASGRCSQLREQIVRNVTLANFFRHYNMSTRARLPPDFEGRELGRGRSKDKDLLKTQADMFEAYVAAIILSDEQNGLSTAVTWLKALWGTVLKDEIRQVESERDRHTADTTTQRDTRTPKEKLSQKIVVPGIAINYRDLPCEKKDKNSLPLYAIGAYLDGWGESGKLLGVGAALNKKEAGQRAADVAIQNKKLLKVYEEKKKAYLEARDLNKS